MALYKYDEKWYCEAKDLDLPRHALAIHLHRGRQGIGGFQNIRNPYYNGRNSKRLVLLESLPVELRRQVEAKLQAAGQQQTEALQLLEEEGAPSQEIAAVATQFTSSSVLHNAPALARALQTHIEAARGDYLEHYLQQGHTYWEVQTQGSSGNSQGSVPFTVTQEASEAVTLSTTNYTIPAEADAEALVSFGRGDIQFTGITHFWVTGRNGPASDISGITSVSHDGSPGKRQGGSVLFTMNVSQNPTTEDRVFMLTLHAGGSSGDPEGSVHFTVTQEGDVVTLSDDTYEIAAAANSSARVNFGSAVEFPGGITDWWVTARDGSAASTIDGITSVSRNPGTRQAIGTTFFTINVTENPTLADRVFMLTLHAGGSSGPSQTSVPFTVTQTRSEPKLISVSTLEQLNAIRYDLDGNGQVSAANATAYTTAFAGLVSSKRYIGYKLTKNLDFDQNASYSSTSNKSGWTSGSGWNPIGTFTGTFDGEGHTISNLHINRTSRLGARIGLFSQVSGATIQNVGIVNPNVTGGLANEVGSLVGQQNGGTIRNCYVSGGSTTGGNGSNVGGLVGWQQGGTIRACYVFNRSLSGGTGVDIGSLIGHVQNNGKTIASYAGGKNYTKLIGSNAGSTITNSYYRTGTSGGRGKTQSQLRTPTNANAYNAGSIYEHWNLNLDGNAATKDPWDFGNSGQYPVLKGIDANADGTINAADLAEQRK